MTILCRVLFLVCDTLLSVRFRVTLLGSAPVRKKLFNMFQTRLLGGIHVSTIFPGSLVTVWDVDIESENLSFTKYVWVYLFIYLFLLRSFSF